MKYKINQGFINQKIGDKTIIFDNNQSVIHELNTTTTEIIKLIKKDLNEREIINCLIKKYRVKEGVLIADVKNIIASLLKKKIISVSRK